MGDFIFPELWWHFIFGISNKMMKPATPLNQGCVTLGLCHLH
jgi:hypothetical protein